MGVCLPRDARACVRRCDGGLGDYCLSSVVTGRLAVLRVGLTVTSMMVQGRTIDRLEIIWSHLFTYFLLGTRFFNTFVIGKKSVGLDDCFARLEGCLSYLPPIWCFFDPAMWCWLRSLVRPFLRSLHS